MAVEGARPPILYFKRFRMELDLAAPLPAPELPPGYAWQPWSEALAEQHAEVKYRSFAGEIDAVVFPNLGCQVGCRRLMGDIARRIGFEPRATWLIVSADGGCGTVQGVRERSGVGAIQNLGVVPGHRGLGLGLALLLQALRGFQQVGLGRALLEVTARNDGAVRLYRRVGFRCRKTLYKPVETGAALEPFPPWPGACEGPY